VTAAGCNCDEHVKIITPEFEKERVASIIINVKGKNVYV
jgi:hypothetical protein